jgi:hypothetical protein
MPLPIENVTRLRDLLDLSTDIYERVQKLAATRIMPDPRVVKWLRRPDQRVLMSVIVLLLASSAAKVLLWLFGPAVRRVPAEFQRFALSRGGIYVVEAVLVILVTVYITSRGTREESITENRSLQRGLRAENQFFAYWPLLWFSWFALYLILAFESLRQAQPLGSPPPAEWPYLSVALNFFNNLSGLFIFAMFYELTERTTRGVASGRQHLWLPMLMLLAIIAVAEMLFYANTPQAPAGTPMATATQLELAWRSRVAYVFQLISGVMVGMSTGLLVSRLTSRLFSLPVSTLAALTLFAVIQPVFPVLTAQPDTVNSGIAYIAAFVALYAKIILLVTIEWMRDRYGILYYMVNVAKIFDDEREKRMGESFQVVAEALLATNDDGERNVAPDIRSIARTF